MPDFVLHTGKKSVYPFSVFIWFFGFFFLMLSLKKRLGEILFTAVEVFLYCFLFRSCFCCLLRVYRSERAHGTADVEESQQVH